MPLMVTFFNVRKGRDTHLQARHARSFFPRTPGCAAYEARVRDPLRRLVQRDRGLDLGQRRHPRPAELLGPRPAVRRPVDPRLRAPGRASRSSTASTRSSCASGWGRTSCTSRERGPSDHPRIVALRELAAGGRARAPRLPVRGDRAAAPLPRRATGSACARSVRSSSSTTSRTTSSSTRWTRPGRRASPTRIRRTTSGTTRSR